jgi:hypothetical protein
MRGAAVIAMVLGTAGVAHADTFDETVDVSVRLGAGWFEARDLPLYVLPTDDAPALLDGAEPMLQRNGRSFWGMLREGWHFDGFRFGSGVGLLTVDGLALAHQPLDGGAWVEPGRLWGMSFELFAGYAFGDAREVRPYLEARGSFTLLETQLELQLPNGQSGGTTGYQAYVPGVGLSAGILVPLNEYFFADVGVEVDLYGALRFAPFVGIGLPIPQSHL